MLPNRLDYMMYRIFLEEILPEIIDNVTVDFLHSIWPEHRRNPCNFNSYVHNYLYVTPYPRSIRRDGSKFNGRVGLACVIYEIYEEGAEKVTFQHRLRDDCLVFQAELLCTNLAAKVFPDSHRQGGTLNFLICTDSFSSLHSLLNVALNILKTLIYTLSQNQDSESSRVAAVAERYRYRIVAGFVRSSSPVPLRTHHEDDPQRLTAQDILPNQYEYHCCYCRVFLSWEIQVEEQKQTIQTEEYRHLLQMMIPACNRRNALFPIRDGIHYRRKSDFFSRRRYSHALLEIRTRTHSVISQGSYPPYWLGGMGTITSDIRER
ncbi:hypothetical protein TNCV_3665481 [Trichonephila clavipes]|nr:hypothetical protein TNCV_3665481 [Trichonephila clavipes]